ncbi:hypothetical protein E4U36_007773 [Claviceps purpurea]|nr:hypothetical protein E4U36_007773 [Claviceps purpurea]
MPGVMRVGDRESGGRRSSEEIDNPDGGGNKRQRAESKKKEMHQKKAAGDDLHDLLARWRQVSGEGESEGAGSVLETQNGEWLHAGFKVQALGGGGQVGRTAYASPKSGAKMSSGCAEMRRCWVAVGLQFVLPVLSAVGDESTE